MFSCAGALYTVLLLTFRIPTSIALVVLLVDLLVLLFIYCRRDKQDAPAWLQYGLPYGALVSAALLLCRLLLNRQGLRPWDEIIVLVLAVATAGALAGAFALARRSYALGLVVGALLGAAAGFVLEGKSTAILLAIFSSLGALITLFYSSRHTEN